MNDNVSTISRQDVQRLARKMSVAAALFLERVTNSHFRHSLVTNSLHHD
jgi:hypothetical protein